MLIQIMDNNQALSAVLARIESSDKPVSFGFDESQEWQPGVLESFVTASVLTQEVQAGSLECVGCEQRCYMPVYSSDDATRAFIVCDDAEKQSYMGRIIVSVARLQQWQASTKQIAVLISDSLGFSSKPEYHKDSSTYELGMLKGQNGRRWVTLSRQPLILGVNQQSIPVRDLLYFEKDSLVLDHAQIDYAMNQKTGGWGKAYVPDVSKQKARKSASKMMYQNWQDEYQKLLIKHPNKSRTWYSLQISKLPIAQGRSSETIRKNI